MYIPFIQRCFVPSLVEIGLMVLEKKCTSTVSLFLQLQKGITLQSYKYFLKVIITTNVKIMCIQKLTPCEEAEVLVFCHREREREREREIMKKSGSICSTAYQNYLIISISVCIKFG